MLDENIKIEKANPELIVDLFDRIKTLKVANGPFRIGVYGESGSGKSVIAKALAHEMSKYNRPTIVLQMDDYFVAPPNEISRRRLSNLEVVGPREVNLELLDRHILEVKMGAQKILMPQIHFKNNFVTEVEVNIPKNLDFIVVEGTYVCLLKNLDLRIFISRTYKDTHIHRTARMREPQTELIEKVLEREHSIVSPLRRVADIVINKSFCTEAP